MLLSAVIIGCCPAFAALYRTARKTQKASYDARGYAKHPSSNSEVPPSSAIHLKSIVSTTGRPKKNSSYYDLEADSSQEELAARSGIYVTKTVVQEDEIGS